MMRNCKSIHVAVGIQKLQHKFRLQYLAPQTRSQLYSFTDIKSRLQKGGNRENPLPPHRRYFIHIISIFPTLVEYNLYYFPILLPCHTLLKVFQYSKTPDLHCCKSGVSLFQRFTPLLYGSVQAENSLRNYSSSEAMCANFSYFSSAYFSAFSKSCSALCGNARVRLL